MCVCVCAHLGTHTGSMCEKSMLSSNAPIQALKTEERSRVLTRLAEFNFDLDFHTDSQTEPTIKTFLQI